MRKQESFKMKDFTLFQTYEGKRVFFLRNEKDIESKGGSAIPLYP